MKANEIRIGNLIKWHSTQQIDVVNDIVTYNRKQSNVNNVNISDCEGVEITDEWLLKSGFKPTYTCMPNIWSHFNGLIGYDSFNNCVRVDQTWLGKMPFLHQLQNLYFVITGEELEINL